MSVSAGMSSISEVHRSRGSPALSASAHLTRSSVNHGSSSPTSTSVPALPRSSSRIGSASQRHPSGVNGNRPVSIRKGGGSRSQSGVAPPPFPNFVNPTKEAISTPITSALSLSTAQARYPGRGNPQQTPSERPAFLSNRERSADEERVASASIRQQQQQQQPSSRQEVRKLSVQLLQDEAAAEEESKAVEDVDPPVLYTPFSLKGRSPYEDIYTTCFLNTLEEEKADHELVFAFKSSVAKVGSPFASVRNEGFREALQQIRSIGMCAAAEAQQSQAEALCDRRRKGRARGGAALSSPKAPPRTASAVSQSLSIAHSQPSQPSQQQQQPSQAAGPPPGDGFMTPFDAIRATMAGVPPPGVAPEDAAKVPPTLPYRSETWDRAQRALSGSDFTSAVFRRVLTPRSEVRAAMNMGGPVNVELSPEDALAWSSRRPPVEMSPLEKLKLESKRAMMAKAGVDRQQQLEQQFRGSGGEGNKGGNGGGERGGGPARRVTPCGFEVIVPETPIYAMVTEITYEEQELALRLLQGLFLTINSQRRCIAEGPFFHYATEVFQCFLQHVEAVFTRRRLLHLSRHPPNSAMGTGPRGGTVRGDHVYSPSATTTTGSSVYLSTPIALGSGTFGPSHPTHNGATATTATTTLSLPSVVVVPSAGRPADPSNSSQLDNGPVDVEEEQVAVMIALIDAVEAACHYSPTCLTRLVQTGGVNAMLNLVYSPCVPESVRTAVLDTVSVLMQEVAPFRRAVATTANAYQDPLKPTEAERPPALTKDASAAMAPSRETAAEDMLLATMLEQARTGSYNYPGAQQSGDAPPFMMDRASASKFESAVREWFSKHGLSHAVTGVTELRNLKDWRRLRHVQQQQQQQRTSAGGGSGKGDGAGGGVGVGGAAGGASIEMTRDSKRATQQRASNMLALLQVIDGMRADLQ